MLSIKIFFIRSLQSVILKIRYINEKYYIYDQKLFHQENSNKIEKKHISFATIDG